jgi:hypothetical protein
MKDEGWRMKSHLRTTDHNLLNLFMEKKINEKRMKDEKAH